MNFIKGTFKVVMIFCFVAGLTLTVVPNADAQNITTPQVPRLSLTGDDGGYDDEFYPDGRIWLPTKQGEPRQFLMPVFMNNNWFNYWEQDTTRKKYIPNPIKSFKFSILYDETILQAESVEILPPEYMSDFVYAEDVLARNFNFVTSDVEDDAYWKQIDEDHWSANQAERERGRRFTIVGTSSQELPNSDQADKGRMRYNVLLFVRFTILAEVQPGGNPSFISKKPVYVDNREILYNDLDATKDRAVKEMADYPVDLALTDYPNAGNKFVTGMDNEESGNFDVEPYKPGSISVHFFSKYPAFELSSNVTDNPVRQMVDENNNIMRGVYSLIRPITVDSNSQEYAEIDIRVQNKETGTRILYPNFYSSAKWLQFGANTDLGTVAQPRQWTTESRGELAYLDNGLLGASRPDPLGAATNEQGPLYLTVRANPQILPDGMAGDDEKTGSYEAWMTFSAPFAEVNPVKLRVPFTFIKNPREKQPGPGETGGINLSLFNSDGAIGEERKLVFGTGKRATVLADALYGEEAYNTELSTSTFEARFYPVNEQIENIHPELWKNGFRDVAPNRYNPRTHSRDIRTYSEDITTHTFHCKFNSGGADKYPVVLEWDVSEFPQGALVYLRDAENGKLFPAVNMRNATNIGGTRYSYTFNDARIKEFYIEYSLPQTFEFVDEAGNASIKPGWNMLSLPVVPLNNRYDNVYPNALNIPKVFTMNQWQDNPDYELEFGEGYCIKYSKIVDKSFVGTKSAFIPPIGESHKVLVYPTDRTDIDPNDEQKDEYGGWNLVGTISYPTSVEGVDFVKYGNEVKPDIEFTKKFGFWKYEPGRGYKEVWMMQPGFAYWIKTNNYGYYTVEYSGKISNNPDKSKVSATNNSAEIRIRDNSQNEGMLYITNNVNVNAAECQLPPAPPTDVFDVRFEGHKYLTNAGEDVIKLQGVTYPAVISIKNSPADYVFTDVITGKVFGSISKGFSGNIHIDKAAANAVRIAKVSTETGADAFEVYPNPVRDMSTVSFSVDSPSYVTVKLYDALGNEVATIAEGNMNAGNYSETLNVAGLNAGNYFCRITSGNNTEVVKVSVIK